MGAYMFKCMHECVYIFYIYVRRVYMFRYTYFHVWSPSLLVFVYMFKYMHTEFASGICVTYMKTEFTCVCVHINIPIHGNYMFEGLYLHISTPSLQMCLR